MRRRRCGRQVRQFTFDKTGVDGVGARVAVCHQRRQERNVGDDAANVGFFQPAIESVDRGLPVWRPRDHFCQHRVVVRRHRIATAVAGIDPQPIRLCRRAPGPDAADRRHKVLLRILSVDPRLDGVAVKLDLVLRQRQLFAECHAQLPFDEIDAGDQLGHGMLDLQPRVHLDEEHVLAVGDEFDGAGADILDRSSSFPRGGAHRLALLGIERRRRRLLDHLLMAALQSALALEQRQQTAVAVADHLHLDMPGVVDVFFDQHAVVAERRLGLALGADDGRRKLAGRANDAHAAAATTRRRLDQHRKAYSVGGLRERRLVLGFAVIAGHQRHAGLLHQRLGTGFGAHRGHHRGRRTDEYQAGIRASLRKFGIFRQESVAGMHAFRAGLARGFDDAFDIEVAVAGPRRPQQHGLIGHSDMHRAGIGFGIDRHRAQSHRSRRADHAGCDLATVGDQECAKPPVHFAAIHRHILNRPNLVGSIGAFAAAASPKPSTSRVSAGSITPSSHSRAVA